MNALMSEVVNVYDMNAANGFDNDDVIVDDASVGADWDNMLVYVNDNGHIRMHVCVNAKVSLI